MYKEYTCINSEYPGYIIAFKTAFKTDWKTIGFFLNDFLWIQRIQWIMTKSKTSMVTREILHLTIDTFLDVVVKNNFPLLPVDWYLFRVVSGNRYLPRGSNENTLYITSTGNVSVSRWVITLVTIPLLDFVMIHWIQWNSFGKNSISPIHSFKVEHWESFSCNQWTKQIKFINIKSLLLLSKCLMWPSILLTRSYQLFTFELRMSG